MVWSDPSVEPLRLKVTTTGLLVFVSFAVPEAVSVKLLKGIGIVYVAEAVLLATYPFLSAMALIVMLVLTVIGLV